MEATKHTKETSQHPLRNRQTPTSQPIWRESKILTAGTARANVKPVLAMSHDDKKPSVSFHDYLSSERESLLRSNLELENFATLAAHDLKSPINAAFSWLSILSEQIPQSDFCAINQSIDVIQRNLRNAMSYVNELLDISKATLTAPKTENCDVNKIINDILQVHAHSLEMHRTCVVVGNLPAIDANRENLECVFSNLIGNAIKYAHPERILNIVIGARTSDSFIEYFVKDNGIGIAPTRIHDIFSLFESFDPRSCEKSTGIGLAFCRRAIERHKGEIWADSIEGLGSTITFKLPKKSLKYNKN